MGMFLIGDLGKNSVEEVAECIMLELKRWEVTETVYDCLDGKRDYDQYVKECAQYIIDTADKKPIFVQCLANGNLEMADDVLVEARTHFDIWIKEAREKHDAGT